MVAMFDVRSSPCPAPDLQSSPFLHAACAVVARRSPACRPAFLAPHRMPFFRLSAGRVGVQPAAELRHLQRHGHALHVRRARSYPMPCPQSAVEPFSARCLRRGRLPPPACRPAFLAPHRMPFFRLSAGRVGVQPAAELRHLQRHYHDLDVSSALLPACPALDLQLSPALHRLLAAPPSPAASPAYRPAYHAPHRMPFFRLSAGRVGMQPAAEL
eukprot:scaffold4429_cov36-Phaeocystis_antarctica.AAC.2